MSYLTDQDYFMGRIKNHEHEYLPEYADNATILLARVNSLLHELKIFNATISSGWRPPSQNVTLPNAAKKSYHTIGMAVDLHDADGAIKHAILERPELLKIYDLWMEHPAHTPTWCHLDMGGRTERVLRVFIP